MPTSSKSPKATKSLLTVIILVAVAILLLFGAKEPKVLVFDNHIQIKGMYGVKIDFAEISDITLIDRSMRRVVLEEGSEGIKAVSGNSKRVSNLQQAKPCYLFNLRQLHNKDRSDRQEGCIY